MLAKSHQSAAVLKPVPCQVSVKVHAFTAGCQAALCQLDTDVIFMAAVLADAEVLSLAVNYCASYAPLGAAELKLL